MINVNLQFKGDCKSAELLTKNILFSFTLVTVLKVTKESKETKYINMYQNIWRQLKLIWIDYELSIDDLALLSFHCFHDLSVSCSTCSITSKTWNLMGTSVQDRLKLFLLFKKKYVFIKKLSFLINTFFRHVLQTSRTKVFITLLYAKLYC